MITADDLAKLKIRHIIFHDVPINPKGGTRAPTLADAETEIDSSRASMLKNRLTRALGSKSAYEIEFLPETSSPVPAAVEALTANSHSTKHFVEMSQQLAQYLLDQQGGQMSPGLLCVIDIASGARAGLAILKLEREQGADLELRTIDGRQRFEMSVLDNLVFTDGTRLFKSALFIRTGDSTFHAAACDSQRSVARSTDVARFWMRFLGCRATEEPRVATQKWFDATVQFVNEYVSDPVEKNDIYEHLLSELKSKKTKIMPKKFVEDYIQDSHRKLYLDFLTDNRVSLQGFEKDTSDIQSKLRRKALYTTKGVTVTMPVDEENLVDIETDQIVVHDQLQTIVHK